MPKIRVPLDALRFPAPVVAGMNYLLIGSLAYLMRSSNEDPPAVTVAKEPGGWRIVDGRHRAVAAMIAGRRDVLAIEVREP